MQATCSSAGQLTSRSSVFAGTRAVKPAFTTAQPSSRRTQLEVHASKGKQRMRTGGNSRMANSSQQMVPPTPPVDPENEEFVIFVRSKKLPQWVPLSVVKGGTAANMLVKGLETEWMKETTVKTLVQNIGTAVYKDKAKIIDSLRKSYPPFKETKEFEFAFKLRDRSEPKAWYLPKDLMIIPPQEELTQPGSPLETAATGLNAAAEAATGNLKDFFSNTFSGFGGKKPEEPKKAE